MPEVPTANSAQTTGGTRASDPGPDDAIFVDDSVRAGLDFRHNNGMEGAFHLPENMGSGGALFDADNDGDLDLLLLQGGPLGPDLVAGRAAGDRLYRNDLVVASGDQAVALAVALVDVSVGSGLGHGGVGMGTAVGDVDNDGRLDVYVTAFGRNRLLRNQSGANGALHFEDITDTSATGDTRWSVPAVFFDFDRDGRLDLYVGNYLDYDLARARACTTKTGVRDYCDPVVYSGVSDRLLHNQGVNADGVVTFRDVTATAGLDAVHGKALGAVAADFDNDGWLDLYVANDGTPNHLWHNRGDGTFEDVALLAGCAVNADGEAEASMGVDVADLDNDGDLDLVLSHLAGETHTVYRNEGAGIFEDVTAQAGLSASTITATGFGLGVRDLDLDGYPDLVVVNGAVRSIEALARLGQPYPYGQPNDLFLGNPNGSFRARRVAGGPSFGLAETSRSVLFGDLDNDGDIDLVVTNNHGPARLLINQTAAKPWLGVRLLGAEGGDAPGARAALLREERSYGWQRVARDGSYGAANDPRLIFALGQDGTSGTVKVIWEDGTEEHFSPPQPGRYSTLRRGTGKGPTP